MVRQLLVVTIKYSKIYHLKQLFLLPTTTLRFTKIIYMYKLF